MKIAILNIYSGLVNRGAETFVSELAQKSATNHQITVIQGGPKADNIKYQVIEIDGVKIRSTEAEKGMGNKIKHRFYLDDYNQQVLVFTKKCLPILEKQRFDIVVAINGFRQLQILKWFQKKFGSKIVFVNQAQYHPAIWRQAGWDNWMKLKLKPDVFVALTEPMYQWANKYSFPKTKVVKIHNGVDLVKFNPQVKPAKVNLSKPLVLCVAGLQSYKRVELLIKAVANSENKNISLLILGEGPLKSNLERLGNKLLGKKRFKIMSVLHDQIPNYYSACDVFSLPSEPLEAFGIAYLEAMAMNKPVVAPNDATRKEIVDQAGTLIDVKDIDQYTKALEITIKTDWKNKPRHQAEKFSWDLVAESYEKLFNQINE